MTIPHHYEAGMLQDRYGLRVAARLNEATQDLSPDVSERLRFARSQALARRRLVQTRFQGAVFADGPALTLGSADEGLTWWNRILGTLPLFALVLGLVAIQNELDDRAAQDIARVDAALLTDDLPPAAYADSGFLQFLKHGAAFKP